MLVSDWMTKKVLTLEPGDNVTSATRLIRDKKFKHIPVVKKDKLVGIVSDRDIREYFPSQATCVDMYELHYLLQSTKVKKIMKKGVITTTPDTPIEEAAKLLFDNNIGCLPVMEGKKLAGIISDRDIFRALVDISGVRHGGNRVSLIISDVPGSIKEATDMIRACGFRLQGIMTSYEGAPKGKRQLVVRTSGDGDFRKMSAKLKVAYKGTSILKG